MIGQFFVKRYGDLLEFYVTKDGKPEFAGRTFISQVIADMKKFLPQTVSHGKETVKWTIGHGTEQYEITRQDAKTMSDYLKELQKTDL